LRKPVTLKNGHAAFCTELALGESFEVPGVRVDIGARTDVGRSHTHNEDSYRVVKELGLIVISDGIGGQAKGEVASSIAVDSVARHCAHTGAATSAGRDLAPNLSPRTRHLANAVRWANRKIRTAASSNPEYANMGATVVAAWLDGEQLSLVHVGDSRAYLFRAGELKQLTRDHSLAAERARRGFITKTEAETSTLQNVLLRALGIEDKVQLEADEVALQRGDMVLLCTDGLTHMVSDAELTRVLRSGESAQDATDRLVELANANGGKDNITAVVLRVETESGGPFQWLRRRFRPVGFEGVN
jgi:PPM family protein phosphatase